MSDAPRLPVEPKNTVGQRIRFARLAEGLSLQQLADRVGISKVAIWSWEHNRTRPRPKSLRLINAALNLQFDDLVVDDRAPATPVQEVIAQCRAHIAQTAGVPLHRVQITITFDAAEDR